MFRSVLERGVKWPVLDLQVQLELKLSGPHCSIWL